jgi:hypothetical protein
MNTIVHRIRIENEKLGCILNETFVDGIQFKLFLKMIHGCIELKNNLTFFNGHDFLIHIPHRILEDSVVITSLVGDFELSDHMKSKIESLVTK